MKNKIRIGLVDDNPSLLEGLHYYFQSKNLNCVFTANSKVELLEEMENHILDVAIMDVIMPDVRGLELFELMNEKHPFTPVIAYSNIRNIQVINELFRIDNVYGLVSKTEKMEVLESYIHQIVEDKKKLYPKDILNIDSDSVSLKLTEREIEVLQLLSQGLSSKQIAEKLDLSENTVLFHRKKLFKAFNTSNIFHLIVEAKECGFLN